MKSNLVNVHTLVNFLKRLGQCYRYSGTLYLVGGSSLLLAAAKQNTFDIDVQFEVPSVHHTEFIRCLRRVSRELKLPVEQASPEQFIPLPTDYKARHQFVDRYGSLDVFHFDFYSVALSKVHRGHEKDFNDVTSMIETGLIEWQTLEQNFQEILPKLELYNLSADPELFKDKFLLLKQMAASS